MDEQLPDADSYYMGIALAWVPSDADPEMDQRKKAEYDKIMAKINVKQLKIEDPRAEWAVTTLRKKA